MMKAICILLLVSSVTSESSLSSVISRLLSEAKSSRNQVPVIVVVSNKALESSSLGLSSSSEERQDSDQRSLEADLWKIFSKVQKSDRPPSRPRRPQPPRNAVFIQRPRTEDRPRNLFNRNKPLRSGVYNSLLTLRNRLRCGARDECRDECSEIPQPKQEKKCEQKCEIKYECDSSHEDDFNPSTRALKYSEEKPEDCPRC